MSDIDDKAMMEEFIANNANKDADKDADKNADKNANNTEKNEQTDIKSESTQKGVQEGAQKDVQKDVKKDVQEKQSVKEETLDKGKNDSSQFDLSIFNKAFEKNFESEDQIKEILESSSKLKAQLEEKEKLLEEGYNPMEYFANEKQFKINQILRQNDGLNETIVNKLVNSDLKEMSDEDVLLLNDLIETKGTYDEKIARLDIKDRYGLNKSKDELDDDELQAYQLKEYRLKRDAEKARSNLEKMLDVELPEFKKPDDIAKERKEAIKKEFNENKEKWQKFTDDYVKTLDKLTIPYKDDGNKEVSVEFAVDDNFKANLKENLPHYAAIMGKDLNNDKDVQSIHEQVQKDYFWLNRSNIVKSIIEDIETKKNKEIIDKYENPSQPKQTEAPTTLSDEERHNKEVDQQINNELKL
jgi:hypothetical protein